MRCFLSGVGTVKALRALLPRLVASFASSRGGNVAVATALILPVLIGGTGLGVEASNWYLTKRSMQNAADSAVVAAVTNGGANYASEARAVAAAYGFENGKGNVSVAVARNARCPSGANDCYTVTITSSVPLFLSQIVGYRGTGGSPDDPRTTIRAVAIARQGRRPREYCILALGTDGVVFRTNGAPKADLAGCNVMANADARCNGHDLGADFGDAAGTNDGCGVVQRSNVPPLADPYARLASNIPADPCAGSYPQMPAKRGIPLPAKNQWSGTKVLKSVEHVCGDLQLTGDVTLQTPADGTALVIWNGELSTGSHTLKTDNGSAVTVIFAGSNTSTYVHAPTGGGTLDIAAPTTGPWKGIAIYQAPNLTSGVDISAAGNSPTWDITGLVYLPHASVTFSGAVNKSSNGSSCFGMVVNDMLINGTASILSRGGCDEAGLVLPTGFGAGGRGQLVQ